MHLEPLLKTAKGDVVLACLTRPYAFSSPFDGEDFALMVVVADPAVTPREQADLSQSFVAQGCRFAVCAGHQCSSWDDSVDHAFMQYDPTSNPPDERYVMTTWYEDETLDEVAWFFLWSTEFDDYVPEHFLALLVGGDDAVREELRAALTRNQREDVD